MKLVVPLKQHAKLWVDRDTSDQAIPGDDRGAHLSLPATGSTRPVGWTVRIGVEIPRGGWSVSGELAMRCIASQPSALELLVPDVAMLQGLSGASFGTPHPTPRDFGEAVTKGFARRIESSEERATGRLIVTDVAPGLGGCTPLVMEGLGWLCADVWLHDDVDVRAWAQPAFAAAFARLTGRP